MKRADWEWIDVLLVTIGTPLSALLCWLVVVAVVVLSSTGAHAQTYYLQEDWEWTPGNSNWPYKNMIGDAGHTCAHTIEHGWNNELFDICPNNAGNTCTWGDGSGEHPCNWAATGISTAQHKSGTRSFYALNPGWQRDSGDVTKTFTATTVGQAVWVNFWARFDSTWADYSPALAEPYIHFFFLNTGMGVTGPRMNLQTYAPYWSSGGQHYCGPGGTQGLPSTTKYLFPVPQMDGTDWHTGLTPNSTMFPNGCYNIMSHLQEWLWFSFKFDPPTTVGGNGTVEIWINDVMYYTATAAWAQNDTDCRNAFCKFILSNFRSTFNGSGPYDQGIYYDDISITDVRLNAPGGSDTTPPTTPGTPVCTSSSEIAVACTWTASTDDTAVTNYRLERRSLPDGGAYSQVGTPSSNSANDTVPATTRYGYRVRAEDAAGNLSGYSAEGTVTAVKQLAFGYGVNLPVEFRDGTWDATQRATALDAVVFMCGTPCWVRMDMTHSTVETTQGTYDWSVYDVRVAELQARGFKLLLMLGYSPAWNRDGACATSNSMPTSGSAFGAFVGAAVARYSPDAIELWNEPNTIGFSCPSVSSANYFTKVLQPGFNASKAARPATAVITAGLGPATNVGCTGTPAVCTTSQFGPGFLNELYVNSGAKDYFDCVGYHPYTNSSQPPGTAYVSGLGTGWMQMEQYTGTSVRVAMTNNGHANLKICTTEWGIPTSGSGNMGSVSETLQADSWVSAGFPILAGKSWAGPSFWYVLTDRCSTVGNEQCWFGLLRSDITSRKRSFGAFKALAHPHTAPILDKWRPR